MHQLMRNIGLSIALAASLLLGGCVLTPKGTDRERSRLDAAGKPFEPRIDQRTIPDLPSPASWQDVLHRAFLTNGELESAYFDWKASLFRIDSAAGYPNSNLSLGFEYMFSSERMKSWDRTTVTAGFDPAMNLSLPVKVAQAGKVALDDARAAGHRFETVKFDVQKRILISYLDLALAEEKLRIQRDNVSLLKLLADTASNRVQAGAPQQDLLKAQIEWRLAENELANLESESSAMRAMLNAMIARSADAPLALPARLPEARRFAADDAALIASATDRNPELAGLAQKVQGRRDALELAKLAYLPEINPIGGFTGSVSQFVGAMVMIPTTIPQIRASINESRAMLRSDEAMTRQTGHDRAAAFVASLYAMRNAERQVVLFHDRILPAAEQVLASSRQAYTTGNVGFIDLIDSQRTLLDVRLMIAESRVEREKRLAEMEALAGVDVESFSLRPTTAPSTVPTTAPLQ